MTDNVFRFEAPDHGDEAFHPLSREVNRRFSWFTGKTFFDYASLVSEAFTEAGLDRFLGYRRIAEDLGRADRIDELLLDVLQGRRSVASALELAADLLRPAAAACEGPPESRLALREVLSVVFETVPQLTEPGETAGDDPFLRLLGAFERLRGIPIETELEPGDLLRLEGVLDLIDNHLPALRLCGEYRDHWRSLIERFDWHDRRGEGSPEFRQTIFRRDSRRRLVRINSVGSHFDARAGEELMRGAVCVLYLERPVSLIADISAARIIAHPVIQILVGLAQIAKSRGVALQIATGPALYPKIQRLVPPGTLPLQRTFADALREMDGRKD